MGDERKKLSRKKSTLPKNKRLHRAIANCQNGSRKSTAQLWNAGIDRQHVGAIDWLATVPIVLFSIVWAGGDDLYNLGDVYELSAYILPTLLFVGIYALLIKSCRYVDRVFARQPFFEYETVLPVTRSMMRTIQMRGLWIELGPRLLVCLSVACVGTAIRILWPTWLRVSIDSIWLSYFHCLSSVVGVWGLGLHLLTVRLSADKRMIAYPLVLVWAAATYGIIYQRTQGVSQNMVGIEWIAVLFSGFVGLFLASLAWVRLPHMESG